jgi:adenylosuccinate synthase
MLWCTCCGMEGEEMKTIVILGAQWGDEGKGKIVHLLSDRADVVCRYQGGNNAGHTVVSGSKKWVFHLLPSGILKEGKICIIGNGVVLDPYAFREELTLVQDEGVDTASRLYVSDRAHLIMPYHRALDSMYEESLGIGTTKRGIGPAYSYKYARIGIRLCDLEEHEYLEWITKRALDEVNTTIAGKYGRNPVTACEVMGALKEYGEIMKGYVADTSMLLAGYLQEGRRIIFEGAQGVLLDIDFGTYPYVTSSNPVTGGVLTGLGLGPKAVGQVLGVVKAYTTRVGEGPFPTELDGETGESIREKGQEFGASTGRPRRCGWFDTVAVRHAVRVSGVQALAMTKFDVLDGIETLPVCTGYRIDGENTDRFPANVFVLERAVPVYEEFPGWESTAGVKRYDDLPQEATQYIEALERLTGVPIIIVSTGPDETETIIRGPLAVDAG